MQKRWLNCLRRFSPFARRYKVIFKQSLRWLVTMAICSYAAVMLGWFVAYLLVGDGFWLLAMVNAFAIYLFVPLLLLLPMLFLSALIRRSETWIAILIVILIGFGAFGGDLMPPVTVANADVDAPALTVMTYNVLYTNTDATPIAASVLQADPDLVAFQELTPLLARQLEREIGERYPHRTPVNAARCAAEVAVWSRYPLQVEDVDPDFLCRVCSILLDFDGRAVRVVSVHGWPFTGLDRESIERSFKWRQKQIELIIDMVDDQPEPLILLGDLNATPSHEVYHTLSVRLTDAFREAGWGLGHTWPTTGGKFKGIPYPSRLVRIDHIFHSAHWWSEIAWVGEWDGYSDHYPVVARLRLRDS